MPPPARLCLHDPSATLRRHSCWVLAAIGLVLAQPGLAAPATNQPLAQSPGKTKGPSKPTAHKPPIHPASVPAPAAAPPPQPPPAPPAEPTKGSATGLPLPRFASLKTDDVNFRSGPGVRYPIDWVYKRRELPVEIEREFDIWRLVVDSEGVKGWVHQATLTGRRTFVVMGGEQVVRSDPQDAASPVARLKPGVVGRLRSCAAAAAWCQVQVADYHGWLKRTAVWGLLPGEAVQ